ncbi:MAG TPA: EamA family transporter [Actinomycetota bacterium]
MIFGLAAALGWGLADFSGAIAGRRIGSIVTVIVGQVLSVTFMTVLLLATGESTAAIRPIIGWIALNGVFTAAAYMTHYRALELGPVAVVSPIGATYAVVGVALAIVVLDERPAALQVVGAVVTVLGVMLVSTDLKKLRAGTHGVPPGLPWAIVAAFSFGVAAFLLGFASKEAGWIAGLWASRAAQVACYVPVAFIYRRQLAALRPGPGLWVALAAGAADILGVTTYAAGAERGYLSIVLAASAVFPMIAVLLSIRYLHERLVANQIVGVALVIAGLLLLGIGDQVEGLLS